MCIDDQITADKRGYRRRFRLSHRLKPIIFLPIAILLLAGCGLNAEKGIPTQIVFVPTDTPAPIDNSTPTIPPTVIPTATIIPSETPIPTNPVIATTAVSSPTPTNVPSVLGTVNNTSTTANLRSGPGQRFSIIQGVKAGNQVLVLGMNSDQDWYNVRLPDDGTEGWLSVSLVTVPDASTIVVLSTEDLARRTLEAGTPNAETFVHKPGVKNKNDILAYCDNKSNGEPRKTLALNTAVIVYWSWYAKTPEQLQDHINYSEYDVKVDNRPITNWQDFKSDVIREQDGNYYVYWYIPIGTPGPGDHRIDFKLSWKQTITDGYGTFGPGQPDNESTVGSCIFTIR
jgi:hypothetical protein